MEERLSPLSPYSKLPSFVGAINLSISWNKPRFLRDLNKSDAKRGNLSVLSVMLH